MVHIVTAGICIRSQIDCITHGIMENPIDLSQCRGVVLGVFYSDMQSCTG